MRLGVIDAVICSIDDAKFASVSNNLMEMLGPLGLISITRVPDAKSMCEGYNRGATQGNNDWIVFCHDDIRVLHVECPTFIAALENLDVFGVAGATQFVDANWYTADPHRMFGSVFAPGIIVDDDGNRRLDPAHFDHQIFGRGGPIVSGAQALDGLFLACRRSVWEELRFSEELLTGWTCYDVDFSYRASLYRNRVGILTDLLLFHVSRFELWEEAKVTHWFNTQELLNKKFRLPCDRPRYCKHDTVSYPALPTAAEAALLAAQMRLMRTAEGVHGQKIVE